MWNKKLRLGGKKNSIFSICQQVKKNALLDVLTQSQEMISSVNKALSLDGM